MHAHTTTHTLILGGVESRDHRFSRLHQIQISIVEALREIDKSNHAAICDLQHAMERITNAVNTLKATATN